MPNQIERCDSCTKHASTTKTCDIAFERARSIQTSFEEATLNLHPNDTLTPVSLNENVIDTLKWRLGMIGCGLDDNQITNRI